MRKNLVLGIAAGAAAVVVLTILSKRTDTLDSLMEKIKGLGDAIESKFAVFQEEGMDAIIPKGEDTNVTKQLPHHN